MEELTGRKKSGDIGPIAYALIFGLDRMTTQEGQRRTIGKYFTFQSGLYPYLSASVLDVFAYLIVSCA